MLDVAALTASFGATMALAIWCDVSGLPALPLLSLGFLAPNADIIWRRMRDRRERAALTVAVAQDGRPGSDTART